MSRIEDDVGKTCHSLHTMNAGNDQSQNRNNQIHYNPQILTRPRRDIVTKELITSTSNNIKSRKQYNVGEIVHLIQALRLGQ